MTATAESVAPVIPPEVLNRRDLKIMAESFGTREARFLVDRYYQYQDDRKAANNQLRSLVEAGEPAAGMRWMAQVAQRLEDDTREALDSWTRHESTGMGLWARAIPGIGPVIAAGLLAHVHIDKCLTAGAVWRFAGLDPSLVWLGKKGAEDVVTEARDSRKRRGGDDRITEAIVTEIALEQKRRPETILRYAKDKTTGALTWTGLQKSLARRPWNADFRVLCWKLGESFVKVSGNSSDIYGKVYLRRKAYEVDRNERGGNAEAAQERLYKQNIGKETLAYGELSKDRLPKAQIHERSKRYAVKLFLAHFWEESYVRHYRALPPLPYPVVHMGHAHVIERPNPTVLVGQTVRPSKPGLPVHDVDVDLTDVEYDDEGDS